MHDKNGNVMRVIVTVDERPEQNVGEKGIFRTRDDFAKLIEISTDKMRESLLEVVSSLRSIMDDVASDDSGQMQLKEAQIQLEVTASGGLAVLGTTAQAGSKGGITLTFKK